MTTNIVNQMPYLRTSREFPEDVSRLAFQCNKSYVDIATTVNARTIGLFPTTRPAITGESWFLTGNRRQQSLRQIYNITSYAAVDHGINFESVAFFTVIRAIGFATPNYFPIPFINAGTATVGIYVTPTQIIFIPGVGAPVLTSGIVILEWLSNV